MRIIWLMLAVLVFLSPVSAQENSYTFGRFGTVKTYQKAQQPKSVALFISGDGGWNLGVIDMARALADEGALVAGVDIVRYSKALEKSSEKCVYPASDFEELSKFVQRKAGLAAYRRPIIVGYSSGATLAYVIAAESPPNTFAGAISLGFCSDLEIKHRFCPGSGGLKSRELQKHDGWDFLPVEKLIVPWVTLHGTIDQVCSVGSAQKFVQATPGGSIVVLPKVGHGFSVQRNWMPQFLEAYKSMTAVKHAARIQGIDDLPIVEVPATGAQGDSFAVMISGDGGWAGIDKDVSEALGAHGVPVVGLNSLDYFWEPKSEQQISADLSRIIGFFARLYHKSKVILIGYSLGAEVLPFMSKTLPPEQASMVRGLALIEPGRKASFEFHLSDWIVNSEAPGAKPIRDEVNAGSFPVLCLAGQDDSDESLCTESGLKHTTSIILPGGNHLGGNYDQIAEKIIDTFK